MLTSHFLLSAGHHSPKLDRLEKTTDVDKGGLYITPTPPTPSVPRLRLEQVHQPQQWQHLDESSPLLPHSIAALGAFPRCVTLEQPMWRFQIPALMPAISIYGKLMTVTDVALTESDMHVLCSICFCRGNRGSLEDELMMEYLYEQEVTQLVICQ